MSLSHSAQSGQHPYTERGLDLYETDELAVEALLRVEKLPHCIWEPAAGRGAIARVLREHGHTVVASDIEDHGGLHFVADFLTVATMPAGTEAIISNPPFKIIEPFIAHALTLCSRVIMLARLLFLEGGTGRARRHQLRGQILDATPPARVYVFRDRLPRMHRANWVGNKASSSIAFAWFVWDRNLTGQTIITRITARADRPSASISVPMAPEEGLAMTKPTLFDVTKGADQEPESKLVIPKPGEFSLDKFKSKQAAALANVETLPTELKIHSIAEARDFVRLHPDTDKYWSPELCFVSVPIKGQKRDILHLIDENLALQYLPPGRILRFSLALATKPYDVFFLCKVPTRNLDNEWNRANIKGCEQARTLWTILVSRKEEGVETYKVDCARDPDAFPRSKWPTLTLNEMILARFSGLSIEQEDHPGLLRLIGARQSIS